MLRWVIAFLLIANLAAFAAVSGAFGPLPSAGDLEPGHVSSQVHPEHLDVQLAVADTPLPASAVVGAPVSTVAPDAASLPASGAADAAASNGAPAQGATAGASQANTASAASDVATSNAAASNATASSPAASAPSAPSSAAQ